MHTRQMHIKKKTSIVKLHQDFIKQKINLDTISLLNLGQILAGREVRLR